MLILALLLAIFNFFVCLSFKQVGKEYFFKYENLANERAAEEDVEWSPGLIVFRGSHSDALKGLKELSGKILDYDDGLITTIELVNILNLQKQTL